MKCYRILPDDRVAQTVKILDSDGFFVAGDMALLTAFRVKWALEFHENSLPKRLRRLWWLVKAVLWGIWGGRRKR